MTQTDIHTGVQILVDGYPAQIGQIDDVWLGVEDHGVLTFNLGFMFDGVHQGLGHLILGSPSRDEYSVKIGRFLYLVTQIIGNIAKAKGREVLVLRESDTLNAPIIGIAPLRGGNPLIFADVLSEPDLDAVI